MGSEEMAHCESVQRHHDAHRVSSSRTLLMLLKSFIGAGVLFLPNASKDGGIVFSSIIVAAMAYVSLEAMWLLIDCQAFLEKEATTNGASVTVTTERQPASALTGKLALSEGAVLLKEGEEQFNLKGDFAIVGRTIIGHRYGKRWGNLAEIAVDVMLTLSQFGFCATTFLFFAQNLQALIPFLSGRPSTPIDLAILIFPQLLFYIPAALLKHLSYISFLAIFANMLILLGLTSIFYYGGRTIHEQGVASDLQSFNPDSWHLFLGTVVYAFEGIGLVLPLRSAMRKPTQFPLLLGLTILLTATLMVTLSVVTYVAYGKGVGIIIFDSLPAEMYAMVLRLLYSLAMVFTVPMTMWPGLMTLEKYIVPTFRRKGKWQKHVARNAIRTLSPILIALLAWSFGSNLDILVSIVGSLCCGPLLFIFPGIFHYSIAKGRYAQCKDIVISMIGVLLTVFVTALTIYKWQRASTA